MKLKSMIMAVGAMILFAAINVNAQSQDDSRVKIMRTGEPGVIKLLYAINTDEPLQVKFSTREGQIASDEIKGGPYPKGFLKKYDVRKINGNDFWIEVSSSNMTVVYRVVPARDRKTFIPYLEKTIYNHGLVARR
jgi:hypothetical protein